MQNHEKDRIKAALPITKLILYYGAGPGSGDAYHCFLHEDKHPSLVANDKRGVATCFSPKCTLKSGSDIFEIIKQVEGVNFQQAVNRVREIVGAERHNQITAFPNERKRAIKRPPSYPQSDDHRKENQKEQIPKTWELQQRHKEWLLNRYGEDYGRLVQRFNITAYHYHIAMPLSKETHVFIPLDKEKDQIFYRGTKRSGLIFPDWSEHYHAKNVVCVEGEKDVLRVQLEIHRQGLDRDWAVVTNTNGAQSLREGFPLFRNFNPRRVEHVLLAYDNDAAGEKAREACHHIARQYFRTQARIQKIDFGVDIKGYDVSDYLDDGNNIFIKTKEHQLSLTL